MSLLRSSLMPEPFAFGTLERSVRVDQVMADVNGPAAVAATSRALTSGYASSSLVSSAAAPVDPYAFSPRLDVQETDDAIQVKADLPGVPKEAVQVAAAAKDGMLIISGQTVKGNEQKDGQGNFVVRERFQGAFKRAVALPSTAKLNEVSAKYVDGVLSITVPKKTEDQVVKQTTAE